MQTLRCKGCGAPISLVPGNQIAVCGYCGTITVLPKTSNDVLHNFLTRAFLELEEGNFEKATLYLNKAQNISPEDSSIYVGKLMVDFKVRKPTDLQNQLSPLDENINYERACRYSKNDGIRTTLTKYNNTIKNNINEYYLNEYKNRQKKGIIVAIFVAIFVIIISIIIAFNIIYNN